MYAKCTVISYSLCVFDTQRVRVVGILHAFFHDTFLAVLS